MAPTVVRKNVDEGFKGGPLFGLVGSEVKLVFGALTSSHFPSVNLTACVSQHATADVQMGFNEFHNQSSSENDYPCDRSIREGSLISG
jgi:hypothetical protein